jgi:class 3 adenylate cyclase
MAAKSSSSNQRDKQRNRVARLLKPHAPPDWEERFRRDDLLDSVIENRPIQMFVMAADIRESTTLMKESIRFEQFALVMDKFVSSVRRGIRNSGGWFDKFTGDGFLAYWIVQ